MALLQLDFHSQALLQASSVTVILPEAPKLSGLPDPEEPVTRFPVLWLLHGLSDDHTTWSRRTSIERYAQDAGLAVVMPAVGRSFYTDMAHGPRYATYLRRELTVQLPRWLPLSTERADNHVAGLSMGGYGALHWALSEPERFATASSLSGALDVVGRIDKFRREEPQNLVETRLIFGDPDRVAGGPGDLFALAQRSVASGARLPRLLQLCGTEDYLLEDNRRFQAHAQSIGLPVEYHERPGAHTWDVWDRDIQTVIRRIRELPAEAQAG